MKKENYKKIIYGIGIAIVIFIVYYLNKENILSTERLDSIVSGFGILAPIVFGLIYIIVILLGFSAGILTISAGLIFGLTKGYFIVIASATIAAAIAFYVGRIFKDKFSKLKQLNSKAIKKVAKKIEKNAQKNGFTTIATLRLAFVPYIWLSYLSGMIEKLKFRDFILATFVTNLFGSFVFIFLGFSITQSLPLFIGAIILVLGFNWGLKKFNERRKE